MSTYKTIAESNNFIVLNEYTQFSKKHDVPQSYQTEEQLEKTLIKDLENQGYQIVPDLNNRYKMLANARVQLQNLNKVEFNDGEWNRFIEEYLDKPGDNLVDKTKKLHDPSPCYDFEFDNGYQKNIYLVSKKSIPENKVQVISQFEQKGTHANRYDVTILVNGLPLVQIELKKRGVAIREAFNQMNRYTKESFNSKNSLFKYLQVFVISNGTDTRYFANTTLEKGKSSYDFTMNWAKSDNSPIKDLKDFTATFFQKNTLLNIILNYSVFDTSNTLLIMRPYQIAATERILWKIKSSFQTKNWSKPQSGGFIWHTTGSGKTLTSFKVAQLATQLDFIDKVFFVVDRKDLDTQTMKEYQKFSSDSVNGSTDTRGLKKNIEKNDNKIIVTTIQKLNILIKNEKKLDVFQKQVVFIFDEAHRSQFGEAQKNLKKKFTKFYQFGFTGTPIFPENALGSETTASVFGSELHSYVITNAIADEKVLKFKVDYNDVRPKFKNIENEQDQTKLSDAENKKAFLHDARIEEISKYILDNFKQKTHRNIDNTSGFNAMFAVSSVDAAKCYYKKINDLQKDSEKRLKVATIFSFAANEKQNVIGEITDESFEPNAMKSTAKEFLKSAVDDYNEMFKMNYDISSKGFQDYYKDIANRVKNKEVDLLIVVGMFLTGFDAPTLNTLFVDKNLRYHGLIQAFSRTNRIYNSTKTFGNIITFRNLEQATEDAIKLFGDEKTKNIVLEKSYKQYIEGYTDSQTNESKRGYIEVVKELTEKFPDSTKIVKEQEKKEFTKLFGEYLRLENILQNYDEFIHLRELQKIDLSDQGEVENFKKTHFLKDQDIISMQNIKLLSDRAVQDYCSTYNDIRDWLKRDKKGDQAAESKIDWGDVEFEIELLESKEINLEYIFELIFEKKKTIDNIDDKEELIKEITRQIRSSIAYRAKESLIIDFINETNLNELKDPSSTLESFLVYANEKKDLEKTRIINEQGLDKSKAHLYMEKSLKRGKPDEYGTDLSSILPKMSPLNPEYIQKKETVFQKILSFVEKFKNLDFKF